MSTEITCRHIAEGTEKEWGRIHVLVPEYRGQRIDETWALCPLCTGLAMGGMGKPFWQTGDVLHPNLRDLGANLPLRQDEEEP